MNPFSHAIWMMNRPLDFALAGLGPDGIVMLSNANRLQAYELANGASRWDISADLFFGSSGAGCVSHVPGQKVLALVDAVTGEVRALDTRRRGVELPQPGWDNQRRLVIGDELYVIFKAGEYRQLMRVVPGGGSLAPDGPRTPMPLRAQSGPDEMWLQWRKNEDGVRTSMLSVWDGTATTTMAFPFGTLTVTPDWVGIFCEVPTGLAIRAFRRSALLQGIVEPTVTLQATQRGFAAWRDQLLYVPEDGVVACVDAVSGVEYWRRPVATPSPSVRVIRNTAFLGLTGVLDLLTDRVERFDGLGIHGPVVHAGHVLLRERERFACVPVDAFGAMP